MLLLFATALSTHALATPQSAKLRGIAAGDHHSLFLKRAGTVVATGFNRYGQLGDGSTTDRHRPVTVLHDVAAVAAGDHHSLFLKKDGTVVAAGDNYYGQLGDGSTTNRHRPVTVLHDVAAVAAGSYHSLFLKKDGNVVAAGNNEDGQLGDGSTTNRHRPVRAKVPQWKIERGDWTQIMCHNGGTFQTVITASSHFESSNAVEASAEIGMEMKLTESAAPFGAGVSAEQTVSPTASATYARLFFEETEHGITATVRCPTSGCLFQYQMRMYQEYGSGTCHWKTQMTTCTKNTAPPGCPPFIPDCKLVGAYMVTDNLQASANAPRVTAFACAFVTMVAVMGAGAAWQRARRRKALASEEVVDEMLLVE